MTYPQQMHCRSKGLRLHTLCCLDISLVFWIIHQLRNKVRIWSQMTRHLFSQQVWLGFCFFGFFLMCTVDCRPVLSETGSIYSSRIGDVFQLHPLMQIPPGTIRRADHFRERGSMSRDRYTTCCTSMESQGDMPTSRAFLPLSICWSITGQRKALWELSFSLCTFFF